MIVIGLTGSIAMGKSETARMFAAEGIPVLDADAEVHRLYDAGGAAVAPLGGLVPGAIRNGKVDRAQLSAAIARDETLLPRIEAIVHPLVRARQQEFLAECRARGAAVAVLDIPLLFETGRDREVDRVVVVTAPPEVQRARALARPGMTTEKLELILTRQVPDAEKRRRADYLVDSSQGLEAARRQVAAILADIESKRSGPS
jgi:dephospho-CoA kinase